MKKFFISGNTGDGFRSFYDNEISRCKKVILLKGAPGTGKSSLMKKIVSECTKRNLDCEEWFCSGDSSSLDGVYIADKQIAVIDATLPHGIECKKPILKEKIYNLLDSIDEQKLKNNQIEIEALFKEKATCYDRAYNCLAVAKKYSDFAYQEIAKSAKATDICREALSQIAKLDVVGTDMATRHLFLSAITPDGLIKFEDPAVTTVEIVGNRHSVQLIFDTMLRLYDADIVVHNALDSSKIDKIVVGKFCFKSEHDSTDGGLKIIAEDIKSQSYDIDYVAKLDAESKKLIAESIEYLKIAKKCHIEAEKYFVGAVDFDIVNNITSRIIKEIFN